MDAIVIRKRKWFNFSYASTRWDRWGTPTDIPIIISETWVEGLHQAQTQGYQLVLFIDSGTVFVDIKDFRNTVRQYPHRGLIGHIIDHLDQRFYSLHEQCFLLDIRDLESSVFESGIFESVPVERSSHNIHDNYTPLWLKPSAGSTVLHQSTNFGQVLIANFINRGITVSNWHNKLRDNKIYLYDQAKKDAWLDKQKDYIDLAEQHLWILNNQKFKQPQHTHVVCPASGIFWMLAIMKDRYIDIVDISGIQLALVRALIDEWDGRDYGSFVYNFIRDRKLRHLQFDQADLTKEHKLQLLSNKDKFVEYVNHGFEHQMQRYGCSMHEVQARWGTIAKHHLNLHHSNLIDWHGIGTIDTNTSVWVSNILDYKYTWLKSDADQIEKFASTLEKSGAEILT